MAGRRRGNWRSDLSVDRYTPDELLTQDLHQQRLQQQIEGQPLETELKQYQLAHSQSTEAKARYDLNKEIETDRQRTAFYNGLKELEANLNQMGHPVGTKAHAEAFAAYAHEFPLARSSSDVDQTLKLHAAVHDDQAALEARMQTAAAAARAQGQIPEGMDVTATGEINLRTRSNTPEARLQSYGYTPQEFLNPYKVEAGTFDANGKFQGDPNGTAIRVTAGVDKTGTGPKQTIMPKNEFYALKQAVSPQATNGATQSESIAAVQPAPDLTAPAASQPTPDIITPSAAPANGAISGPTPEPASTPIQSQRKPLESIFGINQ